MSQLTRGHHRWEHALVEHHCDLLIRGGTVVPMVNRGESYAADLAVRDGRISALLEAGSSSSVVAERVLDARNALVLPGFVQAHVHVVQSLLRHQADELALLDWLTCRTWPYEAALDGDGVEAAAELGIAELLCGGTTTALDFGTTHDHDRVFAAAERLGIRLVSGKTHMNRGDGVPSALVENTDASLAAAESLGRRWHGAAGGRLRYAVAPRFALSCDDQLLHGCAQLARDNGWLLQTHAAENREETERVRALTGCSNIAYLHRLGVTGADVVLAHGVHLDDEDIPLLASTATSICHCPGANLKLASGIADVVRLLDAGINVALGADGAPCNNRLSMFYEMSLAGTLHGLRHGPAAMSAWTVLEMATIGGARALGLEQEIGSLEVGKAADVVVIGLADWTMLPAGDPASRLVYGASPGCVRHVVVNAEPVVVDGELRTLSAGSLGPRVSEAWEATRQRMESCT